MNNKAFKTPKVNKVSLEQSKKHLWNHIQKKAHVKLRWHETFLNFIWQRKAFLTGVLATLLIFTLIATQIPFSPLTPTPVQASFEMVANNEDETGVDPSTSFTLKADQDLPAEVIEDSLKVSPEIDLAVKKTQEGFQVTPQQSLEPNTIYNFSIVSEVEGKKTEFSWAYQVKDTFKITGSLPADKTNNIPVNSGIEIYFSHENYDFESIEDHFEIQPATSGRFENHYRTLSFVPESGLQPSTLYTVTLRQGLALKGTDQKLNEDYRFAFTTQSEAAATDYKPDLTPSFQQPYYEVAEDTVIGLSTHDNQLFNEGSAPPMEIEIYQFPSAQDYAKALEQKTQTPQWAWGVDRGTVATESLELVGSMEAVRDRGPQGTYLYLPTTELEKGYYLVQIKDQPSRQALLQVTNLSAYIEVSQTKSLVWVNDVVTGEPIEDAGIEFLNNETLAKTSEEGLAVFETPEQMKDKETLGLVQIRKGEDVLLSTFKPLQYPVTTQADYWYSFSTDRPTYKGTDTIQFWGFMQPRRNAAEMEDLTLKLTKGYSGPHPLVIEEKTLNLSQEGFFKGNFELKNLPPDIYYIQIYQGENLISNHYLNLENYLKPAYQIQLKMNKEAFLAGEVMDLEVQSSFFDGTPMPNLKLTYDHDWGSGEITTDHQGKASLKIKSESTEGANRQGFYFSIRPKGSEISDVHESINATVFNSKIVLNAKGEPEENQAKVQIQSHWLDLSQFEGGNHPIFDPLGEVAPEREVSGEIIEISSEKQEEGEYYDFINKITKKRYYYKRVEKSYREFSVKTDAEGKAEYSFDMDPAKAYKVNLTSLDDEGRTSYETLYLYGGMHRENDWDYLSIQLPKETDGSPKTFDLGETVEAKIEKNNTLLNSDAEGRFLFLEMNNGLMHWSVAQQPEYSFEFTENHLPSSYLSAMWFDGKNYWPVIMANIGYKKELRELSVDVKSDQESYESGEKVTLNVQVKDKEGKGVPAQVNLNLVDEAYYKVVYDQFIDPLDDLYNNNDSGKIYSYYSHKHPLRTPMDEGGMGGCFVEGTRILMADGSYKPIETIQSGDLILTKKAFYSSEMVPAKVKSTISHHVNGYLILNETLKVTPEHVLFVNGQFQLAGEVKKGDHLLNKDGQWAEVSSIREVAQPVTVYNFEVEEQHTYFAEDFYVHNDKGGDGIRSEFEDNALFESINTNANGNGSVTFQLPDNITSWRVTAKAIDPKGLQAGAGFGSVKVSLPLFADLVANSQYSAADEPLLKFRAYGDELKEDQAVDFELQSKSLSLKDEVEGQAFEDNYLPLPELKEGQHEIILRAQSGELTDAMSKVIEVVGSRLSRRKIDYLDKVQAGTEFNLSSDEPTEITFMDAGRASYYEELISLSYNQGERLDQKLAQAASKELLKTYFKAPFTESELNWSDYQGDTGFKLLPYSESDLKLTVLSLMMDSNPDRFSRAQMNQHLYAIYQNPDSNLEEIILALTGLASGKEPVLTSLTQLKSEPTLNAEEKLWMGLAFEALGDKNSAEEMYSQAIPGPSEPGETEVLKAVLAAALNKNEANQLWEETRNHRADDEELSLHEIGFLKHALKYAEPTEAEFTLVKNNQEETIHLEQGESHSVLIFPTDEFEVKQVKGKVGAILKSSETIDLAEAENSQALSLERFYTVKGEKTDTLREGDLVEVHLIAEAPREQMEAQSGDQTIALKVTDILPSGLTPITSVMTYDSERYGSQRHHYPYEIDGQEVSFMWFPKNSTAGSYEGTKEIIYLARVVNPGKFYADPARIELIEEPEVASFSEEDWVVIERMEEEN